MSPSIAGPVVVAGAGALGSVYGGLLAAAEHDVVMLAHGAHERALRSGPLTVETPAGTHRVPVRVADEAEAGIVILTAKAFDTDAVLDRVRGTPALAISLQNGLAKNEPLLARFGAGAVAGAASTVPARLLEPGVAHGGAGSTYLGAAGGPAGDQVAALAEALTAAGLATTVVPDARAVEWSKVAHVASLMAAQAATGLYVHALLMTSESALLVKAIVDEVATLAGVALTDLPMVFPVGAVARAGQDEALHLLHEAGERMHARGATTARTAALESLEQGKRTEAAAVVGTIALRARTAGAPAAVTEACYERLRRVEASGVISALSADADAGRLAANTILAIAQRYGSPPGAAQTLDA
jgi:2-dehydropantoate 2-reductase